MSLVSTTIPNLANGVSQQPYALRLASQCSEQINGYSSPVTGLQKRAGTRHLAVLPSVSAGAYLHTINRDQQEQYLVVLQDQDLQVYDLEGTAKIVTAPEGFSYLQAETPKDAFRCVTVADYTFILNTTKTVTATEDVSPTRPPEALLWVKQGAYAGTYTVRVNGADVASYTTEDGASSSDAASIQTNHIAQMLQEQMQTALGTDFTVTRFGSSLHVTRPDQADFTIATEDPLGDTAMILVKGAVQTFSDLPARAVGGFTVKITGDVGSEDDDYYVTYNDSDTGENDGVWEETLKGGEQYRLTPTTMPHALIRQSDGSFSFEPITWADREIGDLDTNPFPSFEGRVLNDIFFHRDRLGFLSDENLILSRSGDYFNFFRGTNTTSLDTDPIDVAVRNNNSKVSILRHAVPFNETLLIFSDKSQFQLGASDILTAETVSVNQTTLYECSLTAKPVGAGTYVYFTMTRGAYTGLREYYVDGETEAEQAQEITAHVPQYIAGNVFKLAVSGTEDLLIALSEDRPNEIFLYKYYWSGSEKLQSAWSKWVFGAEDQVLNADFIESTLYLVINRQGLICLESVDLSPSAQDQGLSLQLHLDRKYRSDQLTVTYDADQNISVISKPYPDTVWQIVSSATRELPVLSQTAADLTVQGDITDTDFYVGRPYLFQYDFSTLVIKEQASGGGQQTIGEGRIQLKRMTLLYAQTGYFQVQVTPFRRDPYLMTFSGRVLGSGHNILGQTSLETGAYRFPIKGQNIQTTLQILNDSFLPSAFLSAEWEGNYTIRSRRL